MPTNDEFFHPEEIDEQIDSLTREHRASSEPVPAEERIVSHLQQYYSSDAYTHRVPLDRAWKRIVAQQQVARQTSQRKGRLIHMQDYQGEPQGAPAVRKKHTFIQRIGVLAAILFVCLLIGSMVLALNIGHQGSKANGHQQTITGSGGTPVPTPAHPIIGGKCTIDTTHPHAQESTVNQSGLYIFAQNWQSDSLLYRYDPQTKKVVWSIKLCTAFQLAGTIEQNGILYLAGSDSTNGPTTGSVSYLYALNEADGSAIWGIEFPAQVLSFKKGSPNYGSSPLDLGVMVTPTIANNILYVVQLSGVVSAYNATTGSHLWSFNSERNAWATTSAGNGSILAPSSVQVVNGVAYFSIVDSVFALDAVHGNQLWMHSFHDALNINQTPAIDQGTIYLTTFVPGYGHVMNPDSYVYAFDAQSGTQKWVTKKLVGYINGPVAYNGQVHAMDYDGLWYTFNPASGAILARRMLPGEGTDSVTSPVLIAGVLYSLTNSGVLSVIDSAGSTQWSVQAKGQYQILQGVQNGIIYLTARGTGVYAYSATDGKLLWHYPGYRPQPEGDLFVTIVP